MTTLTNPSRINGVALYSDLPNFRNGLWPGVDAKLLVDTTPRENTKDPTPMSIYISVLPRLTTYETGSEILTFPLYPRKHFEIDSENTMYSHDHHMRPIDRQER
jgi:hypothetical protein